MKYHDALRLVAAVVLLGACANSTAPTPSAGTADVTISGVFDTHRTDVRARFGLDTTSTPHTVTVVLSFPARPNSTGPEPDIFVVYWPADSVRVPPQTVSALSTLGVDNPAAIRGRYTDGSMTKVRIVSVNDTLLAGSVESSPWGSQGTVHVSGSFVATACYKGNPRVVSSPCSDRSP